MLVPVTTQSPFWRGGPIPEMVFSLQLTGDTPSPPFPNYLGFEADVSLAGLRLPFVRPVRFQGQIMANQTVGLSLECPLPYWLIAAIEKKRQGGDVSVHITLTGNGYVQEQAGNLLVTKPVVRQNSLAQELIISQGRWLEGMKQIGFSAHRVIEISLPATDVFQGIQSSASRIAEAQAALMAGRNEEAVTLARKALESANSLVSSAAGEGSVMTAQLAQQVNVGSPGQAGRPPKSERIEGLRRALWSLAHIGPHENYAVTRDDAELVVTATAQILGFYGSTFAKLATQ